MPDARGSATLALPANEENRVSATLSTSLRLPPAPSTRSLLAVVNGNASGAGRLTTVDIAAAVRRAGGRIDVVETASVDELEAAVGDADGRRLLIVGGDGSIHALANIPELPAEVALLPTGTANNVARSLGIPVEAWRAVRLAVSGTARPIDLIEARTAGRRYVTVESVSVGFLAQARVRYSGRNSGDTVEGLRAGAAALGHFHPFKVRVVRDGGAEDLTLGQLFVANLPLYEFGLRVAPHAVPTDELLDFVGIEAGGRRDIAVMLARLLRGSHVGCSGVHLWRAARGRIATHGGSPIVADSENLGPGPVELSVRPRALSIVRP